MGEVVEGEIPTIVLSDEVLELGQASENWRALTDKIKEACEVHGCFLVEYPRITKQLEDEVFKSMKDLFDLPEEIKYKYTKTYLGYGGYLGARPTLPLYESCGIGSPTQEEVQNLANLMWPQGNQAFCDAVNSINSNLQELFFIILRMILEGLGIEKYFTSYSDMIRFTLRTSKYEAPSAKDGDDASLGLPPHIDKDILTFLHQNSVQGLEVLSKDGNWIEMAIPRGSCAVFVGDAFQVWSNGRYEPVKHRVMMKGANARYSYGLFSFPKDGVIVEVPVELVNTDHPKLFRPFIYSDYHAAHATDLSSGTLKKYAGVV